MRRFYIHAECHMGDTDFDLVVDAENVKQARALWRDYFNTQQDSEIVHIFELPPISAAPRALKWSSDVKVVTV